MDSVTIQYNLKDFATQHSLKIHPKRTFARWADIVSALNSCPCNSDRKNCPCAEALDELKTQGYCDCKFFFTKEKYNKLFKGGKNGKDKKPR